MTSLRKYSSTLYPQLSTEEIEQKLWDPNKTPFTVISMNLKKGGKCAPDIAITFSQFALMKDKQFDIDIAVAVGII